jgi:hypothetical protein
VYPALAWGISNANAVKKKCNEKWEKREERRTKVKNQNDI